MIRKIVNWIEKIFGKTNPIKYAKYKGVKIGDRTKLIDNPNWGSEPYLISIGEDCLISGSVTFITHDMGVRVFNSLEPGLNIRKYGRITIGNNCFIGMKSMILPNVSIGDNCIVAAAAVVTKNIPDNEVWGGVPARKIMTLSEYKDKCMDEYSSATEKELIEDRKKTILRIVCEHEEKTTGHRT